MSPYVFIALKQVAESPPNSAQNLWPLWPLRIDLRMEVEVCYLYIRFATNAYDVRCPNKDNYQSQQTEEDWHN